MTSSTSSPITRAAPPTARCSSVADYEGRSANSQVLILIRNCVREYEKENGEIETKR